MMSIKDLKSKIQGKKQSIAVQTEKLAKAETDEAKAEIQKVIVERTQELADLEKQLTEAEEPKVDPAEASTSSATEATEGTKENNPQDNTPAQNDTKMATETQTEAQRWAKLSQKEKDAEMLKRTGKKKIWRNKQGHYFTSESYGKLSLDKEKKETLVPITA